MYCMAQALAEEIYPCVFCRVTVLHHNSEQSYSTFSCLQFARIDEGSSLFRPRYESAEFRPNSKRSNDFIRPRLHVTVRSFILRPHTYITANRNDEHVPQSVQGGMSSHSSGWNLRLHISSSSTLTKSAST